MSIKIQLHKTFVKSIFLRPSYFGISTAIFTVMFLSLLNASQLLFFRPYVILNLTLDSLFNFSTIVILSALTGFVISISVFQIRELHSSKKVGTGITGSLIGAGTGVCTSCSTVGFSLIYTLGVTGATTVSFLDTYYIPIRIGSILLLVVTYFMMFKTMSKKCMI